MSSVEIHSIPELTDLQVEGLKYGAGRVYVLEDLDRALCKIGMTCRKQPQKRIGQVVSIGGISNYRCWFSEITAKPYALEFKAHAHFSDSRQKGEWFAVTFSDAVSFIKENTPTLTDGDVQEMQAASAERGRRFNAIFRALFPGVAAFEDDDPAMERQPMEPLSLMDGVRLAGEAGDGRALAEIDVNVCRHLVDLYGAELARVAPTLVELAAKYDALDAEMQDAVEGISKEALGPIEVEGAARVSARMSTEEFYAMDCEAPSGRLGADIWCEREDARIELSSMLRWARFLEWLRRNASKDLQAAVGRLEERNEAEEAAITALNRQSMPLASQRVQ